MSHASHQALEQRRRDQRHAAISGKQEDQAGRSQRRGQDRPVAGTAPAAPPRHEDEAFKVVDGSSPQSDG